MRRGVRGASRLQRGRTNENSRAGYSDGLTPVSPDRVGNPVAIVGNKSAVSRRGGASSSSSMPSSVGVSSSSSRPQSAPNSPSSTAGNCKLTTKLIEGGLENFENFSSFTCRKFVAGLKSWDDQRGLIFRLDPSGSRAALIEKLIKAVLSEGDTADFVSSVVCPFLIWLSNPVLEKGTCRGIRDKLITTASETPGLIELVHKFWNFLGLLADQEAVAWFIESIVRLDAKKWRDNSALKSFAKTLSDPTSAPVVASIGSRVIAMLDGAQDPLTRSNYATKFTPSIDDYRSMVPGGRHDNDKSDYREVSIIPTPNEISSTEFPFLPTSSDKWPMLDRLFRLMRHDMVSSLKEKIELLAPPKDSTSSLSSKSRATGRKIKGYSPMQLGSVVFDPRNHAWSFQVSFKLPESHPTLNMKKQHEKEEYWEHGRGRKTMTRGTLVMICPADQPDKPLLIAEVVSRSASDLASANPSIGVRFSDLSALQTAVSLSRSPPDVALTLVPVNIALFMYSPVLSRLKSLPLVPFFEELDDQTPAAVLPPAFAQDFLPLVSELSLGRAPAVAGLDGTLDPGQLEGAKMALKQRVTLIQGPPGTGKTYIGTYIASLMINSPRKLKILCVTYTNHAVDDFCEGLLKCGINRLVRLGGRSANEKVAPYTLMEWSKKSVGKGPNQIFNRRFGQVMSAVDDAKSNANQLVSKTLADPKPIKSRWSEVSQYLNDQGNEWVEELSLRFVPTVNEDVVTDEEGFEQVGKKGAKITPEYLWQEWLLGRERPANVAAVATLPSARSCWSLSKAQRAELAQKWIRQIDQTMVEALAQSLLTVDDAISDKDSLTKEKDYTILENMDVVLCTTTAAAKYSDLIKAAQCNVVLVEEAGEILETHVLSSIYEDAEALIMIGDHLQLRPKVESYTLRVESGRGYNLNVSLFERLVKSGYPCATLTTQHRMHPDISRLIRPTYPALQDSPVVSSRDPVKGFQPNLRIAFVSHDQKEGSLDQNVDDSSVSYTNEFEANMVAQIVLYFQRQGYASDQLVVLTPYLGQLRLLMSKLKESEISGRDANDLRQLEPDAEVEEIRGSKVATSKNKNDKATKKPAPKTKNVRVASIDNYQGEESDIVIISLVRNNSLGKMGFVGDPNRVNVLFSRARCGMVILGSDTFLTSVKDPSARILWQRLITMFSDGGELFSYFPAFCSIHQKKLRLASVDDFSSQSPQGGCDAPCGFQLPCGHQCSLKCHPSDREHKTYKCKSYNRWECPVQNTHGVRTYRCGSPAPTECLDCKKIEAERAERAEKQAQLDRQVAAARRALEQERLRHQEEEERIQKEFEIKRIEIEQERQREETKALTIAAQQERQQELETIRRKAEIKLAEQEGIVQDKRYQFSRKEASLAETQDAITQIAAVAEAALFRDFESFSSKLDKLESSAKLSLSSKLADVVGAPAVDLVDTAARYGLPVNSKLFTTLIASIASKDSIGARKVVKPELEKKGQANKEKRPFFHLVLTLCELDISSPKIGALKEMLQKMKTVDTRASSKDPPELNPAAPMYLFTRATLLAELSKSDTEDKGSYAAQAAVLAATFLRLPESLLKDMFPQKYWKATAMEIFSRCSPALADLLSGENGRQVSSRSTKALSPDQELKEKWNQKKVSYNFQSKAMDTLMDMAALRNLKRQMMTLIDRVILEKKRGSSLKDVGYNLRFEGNPGTGKTTVAKLYADLLADLGVIKGDSAAKQEFEQKRAQQLKAAEDKQKAQQQAFQQQMSAMTGGLNVPLPTLPQTTPAQPPADAPKSFIETSGADLVDGGVQELKKQLKQIDEAGGGVLFIDEAYMLEPQTSGTGKQVLNFLLAEMEKRRGSLIVVFAGYKKKLEDLFLFNEGLPSRFNATVTFEDYEDDQLFDIFAGLMKNKKSTLPLRFQDDNDHWCRVAIRRLGAGRGTPGFGNGRSVRQLFDLVNNRQAERLANNPIADPFTFAKEDFLGPSPADAAEKSAAWKKLRSMIGLEKVKQSVAALYEVVKTNEILELQMRPKQNVALNRLFLGNPGTGKTTVAKIYGQILRDFGLLSKGDIVLKAASDFVGSVLGESQKNALAILKQAEGCVLVIDEAYGLHGKDPYKQAVIDTIVEQVQGVPGEDKCVVMLGYREQMETMLRESNPGLQRRFQLENAFQFDDYSNSELLSILKLKMSEMELDADSDSLIAAVDALAVLRDTQPPFGNGGAVANMLSEAISRKAARGAGVSSTLIATDFAPPDDSAVDLDEAHLFKGLIGCDEIIKQLKEYKATMQFAKSKGQDPLKKLSLNFRFVGAPGTGKTTVASRMGRMFRALGVLPSSDVVIASGTDLVGSYVGQTAPKTRDLMDKALGKVLFIDEAYSLAGNTGSFGQEAVDELVRCLTHDKYMNKMVVIVAGYENDIDRLMQANDGLRSRFEQVIHFRAFNLQESCKLLARRLASAEVDLKLSKEVLASDLVQTQMQRLTEHSRFSNGRDIIAWAKKIERSVAMRASLSEEDVEIVPTDLISTMDEMIKSMSTGTTNGSDSPVVPPIPKAQSLMPDAPKAPTIVMKEETRIKEPEEQGTPPVATSNDDDDGGNDEYFGMKISTELTPLNNVLEGEMKLSCDQINDLATQKENSQLIQDAANRLAQFVGDLAKAMDVIKKWQEAKRKAEEEKRRVEEAIRLAFEEKQRKLKPIVQCQVCGATANYWTPCNVAPKIIGYEDADSNTRVATPTLPTTQPQLRNMFAAPPPPIKRHLQNFLKSVVYSERHG